MNLSLQSFGDKLYFIYVHVTYLFVKKFPIDYIAVLNNFALESIFSPKSS